MSVYLTPELEKMVEERVKSGRYISASEVVREALPQQVIPYRITLDAKSLGA